MLIPLTGLLDPTLVGFTPGAVAMVTVPHLHAADDTFCPVLML